MTEELSLASLQNTFTWIPLTLDSIIWIKISQNWSKVTYEAHSGFVTYKVGYSQCNAKWVWIHVLGLGYSGNLN